MHIGRVHFTVKVLMKKLGKNMHDTTKDAYTAVFDHVPSPSTWSYKELECDKSSNL